MPALIRADCASGTGSGGLRSGGLEAVSKCHDTLHNNSHYSDYTHDVCARCVMQTV